MGFFSGFVCPKTHPQSNPLVESLLIATQFTGFALTTSVLYITIQAHQNNRIEQRDAIRQQAQALQWIASPIGAYDRRFTPKELERRQKNDESGYYSEPAGRQRQQPTTKEILKHRWNKEVEALARKVHESRWEDAQQSVAEGWDAARKYVKGE